MRPNFNNLMFNSSAFRDSIDDTVAEWLRRWTRNPLGSARVGSNPTGVALMILGFTVFPYFAFVFLKFFARTIEHLPPCATPDSSVGRACDCRSHGPWFDSGSGDFMCYTSSGSTPKISTDLEALEQQAPLV